MPSFPHRRGGHLRRQVFIRSSRQQYPLWILGKPWHGEGASFDQELRENEQLLTEFSRSGEVLIDLTTSLDLYGGSLSASGACIRNCGDALAQAGASARMKTGIEIVIDELREGADCLKEGSLKLATAVDESNVDEDFELSKRIQAMIEPIQQAALRLEEAGASIMQRQSIKVVGSHLIACGEAIRLLASSIAALSPDDKDAKLSSQRMNYCSEQMIIAGEELAGIKREKPKGKSWLKG